MIFFLQTLFVFLTILGITLAATIELDPIKASEKDDLVGAESASPIFGIGFGNFLMRNVKV